MNRLARSPILVAIFFIFIVIGAANAQPQKRDGQKNDNRPRTATISGRVTIGGKATANVKIVVMEIMDPSLRDSAKIDFVLDGMPAVEIYDAITDADGRYQVLNLPRGKYQAQAMLGGYVREKRPSKANWGEKLVESMDLDDGENRANVDFALVRGGVITGRVVAADGRPLIARVIGLQIVDENAQKREYQNYVNWEARQTDDRGIYRIYGLPAGRYLISAGGVQDGGGSAGKYPRTWHPDTTAENQAKLIDVAEGAEVTGVDIRFGVATSAYEAVGRVVDEQTGKPVVGASLMCFKSEGGDMAFSQFGGNARTDEQGSFRFAGLTTGRYQIGFMDYESFITGKGGEYFSDGLTFEVLATDVSGLEIKAKRGATISGVAVIENADSSAKASLSQTMISAFSNPVSSNEIEEGQPAFGMLPTISRIGSDGGFHLTGIRPGKVTLNSQGATERLLQIVRIERDGADVTDGILVTGAESIGNVRIILAKGSGVIRGQVQLANGALPEGWRMTVTATSVKVTDGSGFSVEVDDKSRFVIDSLLPGEYVLRLMVIPKGPISGQTSFQPPAPVEQKVTVAMGQENQVTITLNLSKKSQEDKQ